MTAQIYVGTYAKYNNGNLTGKWLDCDKYASYDEFIAACKELHKDETDPELMFQDCEGIPEGYYGESHIAPELWDWLEMDDDDRKLLEIYQTAIDQDATIDDARDAFAGTADNEADWACEFWHECNEEDSIPQSLQCHIDWESVARDFRYDGWTFHNHNGTVYVFSPI